MIRNAQIHVSIEKINGESGTKPKAIANLVHTHSVSQSVSQSSHPSHPAGGEGGAGDVGRVCRTLGHQCARRHVPQLHVRPFRERVSGRGRMDRAVLRVIVSRLLALHSTQGLNVRHGEQLRIVGAEA